MAPADFSQRLIAENRLPAAYEYLEQLLQEDRESPELCRQLGWLALAIDDTRAVEIWAHEAIRLDPGAPDPHILLGRVLEQCGRWEEARAEYLLAESKLTPGAPRAALLREIVEFVDTQIPEF